MERSVSAIRDRFYRDLILEYTREGEQSFLYQYFWADAVAELLEAYLPAFPMSGTPQSEDEPEIKSCLADTLKENPEQAKGRLLKAVSSGSRRDFWEELWLNEAGYRAELISDTEYYIWLVEYLAKRDIYYKDTGMWDLRRCLNFLVRKGLRDEKRPPEPEGRERSNSNGKGEIRFTTAQLKRDLEELAEKLRRERETGGTEIAGRLHNLHVKNDRGVKPKDYLSVLTKQLARMALHIRIKTWLQDGGYPLIKPEDREKAGDKARSDPFTTGSRRKRDFSMDLFEAYCSSPRGYELHKKDPARAAAPEGWRLYPSGFCILDSDHIDALQHALEGSQEMSLNIPLAVDLYSGCTFFLAGKDLYEAVYRQEVEKWSDVCKEAKKAKEQAEEARKEYEREKYPDQIRLKKLKRDLAAREKTYNDALREYTLAVKRKKKFEDTQVPFCFDYLRLDEEHLEQFPGDVRGAFRLGPHFHENAKKSREVLLNEFQWYCVEGDDSFRARVREFNSDRPAGLRDRGMFLWAFEGL